MFHLVCTGRYEDGRVWAKVDLDDLAPSVARAVLEDRARPLEQMVEMLRLEAQRRLIAALHLHGQGEWGYAEEHARTAADYLVAAQRYRALA
jgi:hypothetical protein